MVPRNKWAVFSLPLLQYWHSQYCLCFQPQPVESRTSTADGARLRLNGCQNGTNTAVNGSDTQIQMSTGRQKGEQRVWTLAPKRHLEKEMYFYLLTSHNSAFRGNVSPPCSLRAVVPSVRPNKGQAPAFLLRTSFASRRQTASQSLFKDSANPIRLQISEALSPQTWASAGSTSQGIIELQAVIGGDRESEGSRHHKAVTWLGASRSDRWIVGKV